ncbi:MAG: glycosyl hydrolase family 65 protein [bacterium]
MAKEIFKLSGEEWLIREKGLNTSEQRKYESLFTLGNGYLCVRGSLLENPEGSDRGTFIAGLFDKSEAFVRELIKVPGWMDFAIWIGEQKLGVDTCKVLSHERVLDMRQGILYRTTRLKSSDGKILKLETRKVVFAHQVRGALIDISITAENFSDEIRIYSGLNGEVTNQGYFPNERVKHFNLVKTDRSDNHIYLEMETRDDKTKVAMAANTIFHNPPAENFKVSRIYGEKITQLISFKAVKKKTYHLTKWVTTFTSREGYERQLEATTTDLLRDMVYEGLSDTLAKHIAARENMWQRCDIQIVGDKKAQQGIRFNIYHLLISKPHHDSTVSIGAKFMSGEGYKGHVFWDTEIFILPFYIFLFPEDAQRLLMYRYYTMPGAMQNALEMGYHGAKFAWESADTGLEMTPSHGLREDGSAVKIFTGEEEHHIVSDVIYGMYNYVNATGDMDFLYDYGAEMIFQTARFWLSRVERRRERYELRKVIGPDEFHEHVDNNSFTNYLVIWHLGHAVELYRKMKKEAPDKFKALNEKLKLKDDEIKQMNVVSKTIYFPYDQKTELIEQFEGYFSLMNSKVKKTDKNGLPLWPEEVDTDSLEKTQLLKQADVVLMLYFFPDKFSAELKKKNYDYYEARTMHRSSLSPCIHAIMGLEVGDHRKAYDYFMQTSYIDLIDVNGNAADGIHAAATGGAWMALIHGFAGMRIRRKELSFDPWLPKKWEAISYNCYWQGDLLRIRITKRKITFKLEINRKKPLMINVQGKKVFLPANKTVSVSLKQSN